MNDGGADAYRWGRLEIPSRPECVALVRWAIGRLGAQAGLSVREREDLDLAVTEACANAIRHGSPQRERNTVCITFLAGPDSVLIEVRDEGAGFDPASKRPPPPGEMRDGGYGLHIMRQVTDELEFDWQGGTVVRLLKRRKPAKAGAYASIPALA